MYGAHGGTWGHVGAGGGNPKTRPKWADASGVLQVAAVLAKVGPILQHVSSLLRSKS